MCGVGGLGQRPMGIGATVGGLAGLKVGSTTGVGKRPAGIGGRVGEITGNGVGLFVGLFVGFTGDGVGPIVGGGGTGTVRVNSSKMSPNDSASNRSVPRFPAPIKL